MRHIKIGKVFPDISKLLFPSRNLGSRHSTETILAAEFKKPFQLHHCSYRTRDE